MANVLKLLHSAALSDTDKDIPIRAALKDAAARPECALNVFRSIVDLCNNSNTHLEMVFDATFLCRVT